MVFENKAPMGYIYTMTTDGTKTLPKVFGYELKGEGEFNYLPEGTEIKTPEKIFLGDEAEEVKTNGLSVIKFPVFEGCSYWVNATGSKMTACGFYFDETGDATITIENGVSEALTILENGQIPGAAPAGPVYGVVGSLVGSWDDDVVMKLENGLYTATIDVETAGTYEFKIRQDHAWTINWGDSHDGVTTGVQDGDNFVAELPVGSITITFDPATAVIKTYVVGGALPVIEAIWENDGSKGAISWSSDYRFANEEKKTGEEIAAIPMDIWAKMKSEPFFVDLEGENPQIRVTTGWWDTNLTADDIVPGNELLTDNGGGKWTLKVDLTTAQALLDLVDDHHLLFTGDRYTPTKIYFDAASAINSVKKAAKADGAIYNVAGQKVSASYKGLVIKNGKKYIQK